MKKANVLWLALIPMLLLSACSIGSSDSADDDIEDEGEVLEVVEYDHARMGQAKNTVQANFDCVVDADTAMFFVRGELLEVNFLGITKPGKDVDSAYTREALEYINKTLGSGKQIYLEFDDSGNYQDIYGNYEAWVWIGGNLFEEDLLERGYATTAYVLNNKYSTQLNAAENNARATKAGIWWQLDKESDSDSDSELDSTV